MNDFPEKNSPHPTLNTGRTIRLKLIYRFIVDSTQHHFIKKSILSDLALKQSRTPSEQSYFQRYSARGRPKYRCAEEGFGMTNNTPFKFASENRLARQKKILAGFASAVTKLKSDQVCQKDSRQTYRPKSPSWQHCNSLDSKHSISPHTIQTETDITMMPTR
ncbi:MAG: hypothetical protein HN350_09685 [Phycisphaerales bacterium]|jgi:hypothetical protein|nr:hypothetical protein [Phycisphaerales bacterium]